MNILKDFWDCFDYLENNDFEQFNGYNFYKFIFPDNENVGEYNSDFSKPNSVYLYEDNNRIYRRIMLNDSFEKDYAEFIEKNDKALCGGLTYRRKANILENAQNINALIIDLDGVGLNELILLFKRFGREPGLRSLPMPTFLVLSGTGLHLYYVFDVPIALFPNIKLQLKALKYDLTFYAWDYKATSKEKQIQYQSLNQSFRMVGSVNSKYGNDIVAFKIGGRVSLEYINSYMHRSKVDINKPFKPSKMTRKEAKEKYPEWYQRVVVEGNKRQKKWNIKSKQGYALYNWWLSKVDEIRGGHRYFYMMCLSIYACKCDVPKKKLKEDMKYVFNILSSEKHTNELTQEDIKSALEAYSKEYYNFTIKDIEYLTDLRIERNRRNYRKQEEHLKGARALRDIHNPNWRDKNGRKSKEKIIKEWRLKNPLGRKIDCIRETGLSKMTVYKWW